MQTSMWREVSLIVAFVLGVVSVVTANTTNVVARFDVYHNPPTGYQDIPKEGGRQTALHCPSRG